MNHSWKSMLWIGTISAVLAGCASPAARWQRPLTPESATRLPSGQISAGPTTRIAPEGPEAVIRYQGYDPNLNPNPNLNPDGTPKRPGVVAPAQYAPQSPPPNAFPAGPQYGSPVPGGYPAAPAPTVNPPYGGTVPGGFPPAQGPPPPGSIMFAPPGTPGSFMANDGRFADVVVNVEETETGKFSIGAAVNSDAGVTGQIIVDERNFDWRRVPRSWDDIVSGRAFRGAGQSFRLEALPGSQFHRYSLTFTEPYLFQTPLSSTLNGFLYSRRFLDYNEERIGGRVGLGYRVTPELSLKFDFRAEQVELSNPRVLGVPELDEALGTNDLFGGSISLIRDTRDIPFAPSQGSMLQLTYEQVFGDFDFPRGELAYQRHFLIAERADGSGRHVLSFWNRFGITGSDTPIFENFFAGGYSTMRGFSFRGASPRSGTSGVLVGGELQLLGSVEYLFPITADDMVKGVVFCDYGTVEEELKVEAEDYRVSLGAGLRLQIPAMGPAPLAFDFAVPVAREDTDDIQTFSFFVGFSR